MSFYSGQTKPGPFIVNTIQWEFIPDISLQLSVYHSEVNMILDEYLVDVLQRVLWNTFISAITDTDLIHR